MLEREVRTPGLRSLAAFVVAAGVAGCGSASTSANGGAPPPKDGGQLADAAADSGWLDSGSDGPASPAAVIFVNASPSLGPLRLCWSSGAQPLSASAVPYPSGTPMPASNYAGIAVGGAEWLDAPRTQDLARGDVTLFALDARSLVLSHQEATPCGQLICNTGCSLRLNWSYWKVGVLPAGTLAGGATNVIAISGCLGAGSDTSANAARCGSSWDAVRGNLHADAIALPPSPTDAGLAIQAAQFSPGMASLVGDAGAAVVTFGRENDADAAILAQLADEAAFGPLVPAVVALPAGLPTFGQLGFAVDVWGVDAGAEAHRWTSLAQAQALVNPALDPAAYYGASGTYLVALVGDPMSMNDGGYDGTGLHVLVLPPARPSTSSPSR